jgi:Gas vesicle protein K
MDGARQLSPEQVAEAVAELRQQLTTAAGVDAQRVDCSPESVEQGLVKLVLGLIELLRRLLERQAVRRMDGGSLSEQQIENMGVALMRLEEKLRELAGHFGLRPEDLNLDLGPLGNLLDE